MWFPATTKHRDDCVYSKQTTRTRFFPRILSLTEFSRFIVVCFRIEVHRTGRIHLSCVFICVWGSTHVYQVILDDTHCTLRGRATDRGLIIICIMSLHNIKAHASHHHYYYSGWGWYPSTCVYECVTFSQPMFQVFRPFDMSQFVRSVSVPNCERIAWSWTMAWCDVEEWCVRPRSFAKFNQIN